MVRMKFSLFWLVNYSCKDIRNPSFKSALLNGIQVLNRLLHIRICVSYVVRPLFYSQDCILFHLFSCDNGSSCSEIEFEEAYYANNSNVSKGIKRYCHQS